MNLRGVRARDWHEETSRTEASRGVVEDTLVFNLVGVVEDHDR